MSQQRKLALGLYRTLLRLHRKRLPPDMRSMGDAVVKHEFREHRAARPEHLAPFFAEWLSYADRLQRGQHLSQTPEDEDIERHMNEEQVKKLRQLRDEIMAQSKPPNR